MLITVVTETYQGIEEEMNGCEGLVAREMIRITVDIH